MTTIDLDEVRRLAEALAGARRAIAFTGAGISTESGIPDFRGPQGVWTTIDPSEFTIDNYVSNPEHRKRVWRMRIERANEKHLPNDGHHALVDLEELGILDAVVTQNIDGLHQDAGSSTVLELHGNTRSVRCLTCGTVGPTEETFARVEAGEEDPRCLLCGGILKSATISFGEALPEAVVDDAFRRAEACDVCLVVGSSLVVYPAAGIPVAAVRSGAHLAIVNQETTPLDDLAHTIVRGSAGVALSEAVRLVREMLGRA